MAKLSNKELIHKAQVTTDAIATAGKLNDQQANKFIDYVYDLTKMRNRVRTIKFRPENLDIDKINIGKRAAVPKVEGQDPGIRRGISTSKIQLSPKKIMVPFEITDDFIQYNIEEDQVEDHIIKMMATQLGNDLEEYSLDADSLGHAAYQADLIDGGSATQVIKDSYLGLGDGWLKHARGGNVVDVNGANISSTVFNDMLKALPEKYKRYKPNLRFFCSSNIEQNYRQVIGSRATAAGDSALQSMNALTPYGVMLDPVPMFNNTPVVTEHVTLTGVTPVQLQFKNIQAIEIVVPTSLANTPITPYVEGAGNDYVMDYTAGTIRRDATSTITSGATVKITYRAESQILLCDYRNLLIGISNNITIEKDRDIFKSVNQYAITCDIAAQIENLEAVVWAKNVGIN